ncbi:MAG: UDP-N-acetylmuramoyl-L-alanyl-D-glutamate--2,6-diaminopimelate ligase [Clostridiales bacterium]|jgi:UDP-N-acetylmuramoyl-L-alanyl-D-glutamate--2,6-diaminopimelate ligase|nr:UDP-N-acetylmuramoyl-L-alanyl-D-glutamate--2,6-diaminopimelate ligase [Clostridiales bacterium]
MKLKELLTDVEAVEINADTETEIADISYDSRKTRKNDFFVAIRGFESDGHKYIGAAVNAGAAVVLCEEKPEEDIPYVLVRNSREALALVSRNYFGNPASEMTLVGVTGTNGKTTTTMLIKHVLEDCTGEKAGLIGTNQNMIGERVLPTERTTPESYELQKLFREMADEGCKYAVMEVSSHSLVLDRVSGLRFEVAVFTNLTQDHLDFHKSMEEYAAAKALLFERCNKAAINIDDEWGGYMREHAKCPVFTYSETKLEADLIAKDIRLSSTNVKFCALAMNSLERVSLEIPGKFSVYNAMSVIAAALLLNVPLNRICESLKSAKGVKGRVEVVPTPEDYTILIDYAHTPDALENVIKSMKEVAPGRVVVLFGCGGDRDKTKRPIMGEIAAALADFVIITSDNPRTEVPGDIIADILAGVKAPKSRYKIIEDRSEAIAYAIDNHMEGDVIILAGKGHETYQIIGKTKQHMDEREIVAEHIKSKIKA